MRAAVAGAAAGHAAEQGKPSAQAADSVALVHCSDPYLLQSAGEPLRCGASGASFGPRDMWALNLALSVPAQTCTCSCMGR